MNIKKIIDPWKIAVLFLFALLLVGAGSHGRLTGEVEASREKISILTEVACGERRKYKRVLESTPIPGTLADLADAELAWEQAKSKLLEECDLLLDKKLSMRYEDTSEYFDAGKRANELIARSDVARQAVLSKKISLDQLKNCKNEEEFKMMLTKLGLNK